MTISATTQGLRPGVTTSSNRPATPFEGQMIYETDTDLTYIYGGSAWQQVSGGTAVGNSGLVFVKSQTIGSAVSSVNVTSAFSSTYDTYKIVIAGGASSAVQPLKISFGSTITGYNYSLIYASYAGVVAAASGSITTAIFYIGIGAISGISASFEVGSPNLATVTTVKSSFFDATNAGHMSGYLNNTTSYTGFTVAISAGTMTGGTITVYGYRKG